MKKINLVLIAFLVFGLMIGGVNATLITNDGYVSGYLPDTNYGDSLVLKVISGGVANTYIDLTTDNPVSLHLYVNVVGGNHVSIFGTTVFDKNTLTWNNAPAIEEYNINDYYLDSGWNIINISGYQYINIRAYSGTNIVINSSRAESNNPYIGSPSPSILSFTPSTPINSDAGFSQNFNMTTDQTVTVNWYINGSLVQTDSEVSYSQYINASGSSVFGVWNVTAIASNSNGVVSQSWIWDVAQSTPIITWNNPADITYGTPLSVTQLDAIVTVGGSNPAGLLTYTPDYTAVIGSGNQTLHVVFNPTDTASYTSVSKDVNINVTKTTPTITWGNPANIIQGTPLNGTQLNASSTIAGSFIYSPVSGTILPSGAGQNLHVDFTPTDSTNYTTASKDVSINVVLIPQITWNNPADIAYGTALSGVQNNAYASNNSINLSGTFIYTPSNGTILPLGAGQNLHVDFTPTDSANYTTASKDVSINVTKATPTITWSNPTDINNTTPLSGVQLDATASVAGTFIYIPPADTILSAGNKTLHADFTPTDSINYTTASKDVNIFVTPPMCSKSYPEPFRLFTDSDFTTNSAMSFRNDTQQGVYFGNLIYLHAGDYGRISQTQTFSRNTVISFYFHFNDLGNRVTNFYINGSDGSTNNWNSNALGYSGQFGTGWIKDFTFKANVEYTFTLEEYVTADVFTGFQQSIYIINYDAPCNQFASGNVEYIDVDNSTNSLEGALVYVNETINATTDTFGNYQIPNLRAGTYTITAQKSSAFNIASGTISNDTPILDFTLLYSKPSMATPYISSRGTISGAFSHNFKSINLWEEPNYVWGEYYYFNSGTGNYSDVPYYKACQFYQGNIFECDNIAGTKFKFRFVFSDVYNTNLADWHPTLTGSRNFTSDYLYAGMAPPINKPISSLSTTADKEKATSFNFWNAVWITLILVMMIIVRGFNTRDE